MMHEEDQRPPNENPDVNQFSIKYNAKESFSQNTWPRFTYKL